MNSSFRPLKTASSTRVALAEAARCYAAGGAPLAGAVASGWRDDRQQTWCDAAFDAGWTFLTMWRAWQDARVRPQRLHIVGVVHQPYTRAVLRDLLSMAGKCADGAWRACAQALVAQWPAALPGQHRLTFEDGCVTLTLLFGDPARTLPRAGFLADGFLGMGVASCKVADYVAALARHAARDATWWAADDSVLRAAWRRVAFVAQPATGVQGEPPLVQAIRKPGVPLRGDAARRTLPWTGERHAVVIGAGVAGAHAAYALARRGWRVTVLADDAPSAGHVCAAVTPVVSRDDDARARLTRAGTACAVDIWRTLAQAQPSGSECATWTCGTVQVDKPGGRAGALADTLTHLGFPPGWVRAVDCDAASRLAGLPLKRGGLYFSQGTRVRPDLLVAQLLAHPNIQPVRRQAARLARRNGSWQVLDAEEAVLAQAGQVVLATAGQTPTLLAASGLLAHLPILSAMHRLGGEVMLLPAADLDGGPACVVAGEGYVLPALAGQVVVGSTYIRGATDACVTAAGQRLTIGKLQGLINTPAAAALVQAVPEEEAVAEHALVIPLRPGWAGWRAVVAGRLPQIGAVPHASGLWLATAFGSRGLTWAALAGEMMAGALAGEPDVLDADLAKQVAPR